MISRSTSGGPAGHRLKRAFSAQVYGQVVTIGVQIVLVPVLIALWGVELYGSWLLISAVPTYLAFSDFGFTYVAKNLMVSQVASGDREAALRTFQSVFALLNIVAAGVVIIAVPLLMFLDIPTVLGIAEDAGREASVALAALIFGVVAYQYLLLLSAGVRSENRAAAEGVMAASGRLLEAIALVATAAGGGGLIAGAVSIAATRVVYAIGVYLWLRGISPWLSLGLRYADRGEIRAMLHPAIAFALIPLSQALMIQGPVLIVGSLLGPVAVVLFATTRTVARLGTSVTNVLNNTFVTEYAYRYGSGETGGFLNLYRRHRQFSVALIAAYATGVFVLGGLAVRVMTHDEVSPTLALIAIMVAGVVFEMLYSTVLTPLSAANRHVGGSHLLLVASAIGLVICYPATQLFGVAGAGVGVLIAQAAAFAGFLTMWRRMRGSPPFVPA